MIIEFNLNEINESKISLNGYFICYCIYHNRKDLILDYIKNHTGFNIQDVKELEDNGWIKIINKSEKIIFENLQIEEKFRIFVEKKDKPEKDWINEWLEMFPKGVKSGGYYIKTDLNGCRKKMRKFTSTHPEYTKETIIKATQNYINRCYTHQYLLL